jgi:tetratricopeptide (TPR) repeat protein
MWSFLVLSSLSLILLVSTAGVFIDVEGFKSCRFALKRSLLFALMAAILVVANLGCSKEKKTENQGQGQEAGQARAPQQTREAKLLAQLQDYLGVLVQTDKPQVSYYLDQGQEFRKKGEYADAVDVFQQALDLHLSDQERLPFFVLMGNCEAYLKQYTPAINYYYQAERMCKNTQDDTALVLVYSNLALTYQLAEEPKGALGAYFDLLGTFKKLKEIPGQKSTLGNIAFIYQTLGEVDSASYYQRKSLEMPSEGTSSVAEAAQINNLALTYHARGMPDSALALFDKALSMFREAGDKSEEASVLVNLGLIYQEKKDVPKAVEYYQSALGIDSATGNLMGQGGDLTNLGSAWEQGGDLTKAKQYYQQALSLFQQVDAKKEADFVSQSLQRVQGKLK